MSALVLALCLIVNIAAGVEKTAHRYVRAVLSEKSLSGYWRMEGDLSDEKTEPSGVLRGGQLRFVNGPVNGEALSLAEGQFVIVEKTPQLDVPETTVELFFNIAAQPTCNACLVAKRSEKETRFSIHVSQDLTQLQIWNGRAVIAFDFPTTPLSIGEWHHLAVAASAKGLAAYRDGVPFGQTTGDSFNFSVKDLPLLIGAATPAGFEQCVGAIDEVAVYSRVLRDEEIAAHVDAAGWAEKRKSLLTRREELAREKRAREEERRRKKMEVVAEWMNDPRLLARGETRAYRGEHSTAINVPLGGIGAGCIQINGKAELAIWQIFNNFIGAFVPNSFFAVRAKRAGGEPVVRALQTSAVGPFGAMKGLSFRGEYPFAWFDFEDPALPVVVSMEAFNPLIPLNARDSAMPCAIFGLTAKNASRDAVEVSFIASQQNAVGFTGDAMIEGRRFAGYGSNRNRVLRENGAVLLHMTSDAKKDSPGCGDMALATFDDSAAGTASWTNLDALFRDISGDGVLTGAETAGPSPPGETLDGALATSFALEPGQSRTVTFVLSWYFPNGRHGHEKWGGTGNMYANWWENALGVAHDVRDRLGELRALTRLYHDTFYASNLPRWLLNRISSQVAILRTKTCFWTKDGYFGGWEGCCPDSGCCHGNCAHVWHYAQAHARLFPEIARRMRQQSLAHQTDDGKIPFRQPEGMTACDGQCGEVLEAYREHLGSADGVWLDKNWPRIKRAMDYAVATWDRDEDGVLSGAQHNTLDCEVSGSTSWLGSVYLAALAASEKMAELQRENPAAQRYRRVRESGATKQNETLWNGEYYTQVPDPQPEKDYNDGCHIDQVLGEWWTNQIGLAPNYPADRVRSALRSLLRYNFQTDLRSVPQKPRKFVSDDDAGMQMITWPKGERPHNHTLYADEVMTGFEYSAAAAMVQYGLLKEGFLVVKAISDRYDGRLRADLTDSKWASWGYSGNPFGDDECGKFYARAMSVWSVLLACQGFGYDGPAGVIGFKPIYQPEDHATFFTAAEGWGIFCQKREDNRQTERIELKWGRLRIRTLVFELPHGARLVNLSVTAAGKKIEAQAKQDAEQVTIALRQDATIARDQAMNVTMVY